MLIYIKRKVLVEKVGVRKLARKVLVPSLVWEDFEVEANISNVREVSVNLEENFKETLYRFPILFGESELIDISASIYEPENIIKTMLIVPEYHRTPSRELIEALVENDYRVVVPDISGTAHYPTVFPPSLSYGEWQDDFEAIYTLSKTAKETAQFLYSFIVKRTVNFLEQEFNITSNILVGLGTAVDVAMQVAGSPHKNIEALVCLNGCGYGEMQDTKRFRGGEPYNDEKIAWLSGVSAVAYQKHITVPVFIAIGSNSKKANIDKLEAVKSQLVQTSLSYVFCPGISDFVSGVMFNSMIAWLTSFNSNLYIPKLPEIGIRIDKEDKLYIDVTCDPGLIIDNVKLLYCFDEPNNQLRDWRVAKCYSTSYSDYVSAPKLPHESAKILYTYALVFYTTGLALCTRIYKKDISKEYNKLSNSRDQESDLNIIYQPTEGIMPFVENYEGDLLRKSSLRIEKSSKGLSGITGSIAGIKTYKLKKDVIKFNKDIIQLNICSDDPISVKLGLICAVGDDHRDIEVYSLTKEVPATAGYFYSYQFTINEFKNNKLMPIIDGKQIKALTIIAPDALIGNILVI